MSSVKFQIIENIKAEGPTRRFFRAVKEFLPLLYSEYAMSFNLNTETELYKDIRQAIQDNIMSLDDLCTKLKKHEKVAELISLFPESDDIDAWSNLFNKCTWESLEGNNIFEINGRRFVMSELFLHLVKVDSKYYAYKYAYDKGDGTCSYECFNTEIEPSEPIEIDNPFIFTQNNQFTSRTETHANMFEMSEEEFFELESINSADEEQRRAISAGLERNIVVLAGAGSGKTRTLVSRLVYLHMVKKIPLERILLLTFTKNAAENMKKRGESILEPIYEQYSGGTEKPNIRAKTIDAFVYGIIRECYQEIGFTEEPIFKLDTTIETKREFAELVDQAITENDMKGVFKNYYRDGKPNDFFKYLIQDLEKYACGMSINYAGIERLLYEVLQKQIALHTIYNFAYANQLVKDAIKNGSSALKEIIASRYDCILLDEFQDINILQNDTFEPFYNTKMHFTFVGDDDQSIYGWRGSDNSIIKRLVEAHNVDTYYLLTNYRNNPNIVKAGNAILRHISGRAKKNQDIKAHKIDGAKIRIASYDDKYTNLANEVERLIQSGFSAEDISILSRNNDDKTRVAHALNACEIPVAKERIKIDVNDNYKLLKAIVSILNEYNIIAACREIKRITNSDDLTENYIQKLVLGKVKPKPDSENLEKVDKLATELRDVNIDNMAKAIYLYSLKAGELFEKSINDRHSDPVFDSFELYCSNNSAPWPISAKQLKEILLTFEDNTRKENQSNGAFDRGVKISTIHSAKGLEYDVVLITGLSLGKYPNTEQIDANYNRRNAQLQTLQESRQSLQKLQSGIDESVFLKILKECVSPMLDIAESKALKEFKNEIIVCSKKDIIGLTVKGVESYLDSYKYYVAPLEKRYNDEISKLIKQAMRYKEKEELLNEEISILEQADENIKHKKKDLETVAKKLEQLQKKIKKQKSKLDAFCDSIQTIRGHYKICLVASSYLSEVVKLNEIEQLKKNLQEERERSVNEERRLFYVALTRAKDILYLCHEQGAQESEFISLIPDELKEQYAILTKEDEREFIRLKKSLAKEIVKETVNNEVIDSATEKLVANSNFKDYIKSRLDEFVRNNPIFAKLPNQAKEFFEKAMGLLYIGEYTGADFKTEFAHNMQRMAETLLLYASGNTAVVYKTEDKDTASEIANEIHAITRRCSTCVLGVQYIIDLLTKESRFGDELQSLKSAGVFHYIIRSQKYSIPNAVTNTWNIKFMAEPDKFLIAVTDVANVRNCLIHPSDKKWPQDPVPMTIAHIETIIKNCYCVERSDTISATKKGIKTEDIKDGVVLKHETYGVGTVVNNTKQSFIVDFKEYGRKVFMKYSSEKYFVKN